MHSHKILRTFKSSHSLAVMLAVSSLALVACASTSPIVSTKYVGIVKPLAICESNVAPEFTDPPTLETVKLEDPQTTPDIETLADAALGDVLTLLKAFKGLAGETKRLEAECVTEKGIAANDRAEALEKIRELNDKND